MLRCVRRFQLTSRSVSYFTFPLMKIWVNRRPSHLINQLVINISVLLYTIRFWVNEGKECVDGISSIHIPSTRGEEWLFLVSVSLQASGILIFFLWVLLKSSVLITCFVVVVCDLLLSVSFEVDSADRSAIGRCCRGSYILHYSYSIQKDNNFFFLNDGHGSKFLHSHHSSGYFYGKRSGTNRFLNLKSRAVSWDYIEKSTLWAGIAVCVRRLRLRTVYRSNRCLFAETIIHVISSG